MKTGEIKELGLESDFFKAVRFSADSKRLLLSRHDRNGEHLHLYDLEKGADVFSCDLSEDRIKYCKFSPDLEHVLEVSLYSFDRGPFPFFRVVRMRDQKVVVGPLQIEEYHPNHEDKVSDEGDVIVFSPNSKKVVLSLLMEHNDETGKYKGIVLIDLDTYSLSTYDQYLPSITFSKDSTAIAGMDHTRGYAYTWILDMKSGRKWTGSHSFGWGYPAIEFVGDTKDLLVKSLPKRWDSSLPESSDERSFALLWNQEKGTYLLQHLNALAAFSPDHQWIGEFHAPELLVREVEGRSSNRIDTFLSFDVFNSYVGFSEESSHMVVFDAEREVFRTYSLASQEAVRTDTCKTLFRKSRTYVTQTQSIFIARGNYTCLLDLSGGVFYPILAEADVASDGRFYAIRSGYKTEIIVK